MDYPSFLMAFQEAQGLKGLDEDIRFLECHLAGNLIITSGRIMACDPYYCTETEPFEVSPIAPGQYPVTLVVAHIGKSDQRVALAALKISDAAPVRWEIATPVGWNPTRRSGYTYCVDSGIGCFMDSDAASLEFDETYDPDNDPLLKALSSNYTPTWGWASVCTNPSNGANIIAFSSGWGDGGYPSYFGYDRTGNVVCLVTDFGILDEE